MFTAYVIVTVLAAAFSAFSAVAGFVRPKWILDNMTRYGVPHSWLFSLSVLKAAGALGLLVGIGVPAIGVAASIGLVLYFVGAIAAVVRGRVYSHLSYPVPFLLLAAGSLGLGLATA
ncbi:DoxX family protein [Plantactinospora solaniradicis]|uniref:DoxX family protein n=1 Tax=Plantactinospora solaniradicis TaxID=1723736 RepID=A0ABW1KJ04_9ACTN